VVLGCCLGWIMVVLDERELLEVGVVFGDDGVVLLVSGIIWGVFEGRR
jgi:hypothetical protein